MLLVGILVGTWFSQPRKPRVLKIQPESGRGEDLEVEKEDAVNVYCPAIENTPPQRFIKIHQAFTVIKKGRLKLSTYPLWIGRYGTAYTQNMEGNPKPQPIKVPLREAIKNLFGELYDKIPNDKNSNYLKDRVESSEVGVTIEFERDQPLTPLNPNYDPDIKDPNDPRSMKYLPSVSSDDIRRGEIDTFIGAVAHGIRSLLKGEHAGEWIKIIFILGSGFAIGVVASLIFGWGGSHTVVEKTAEIILGLCKL
jgi:hypothetical protein